MKAALKTLVMLSQESGGASWAILGKMHELGSKESSGHLEVAEFASQLGVDHLVSVAPAVYQESNNQSSDENMLIHNCSSAAAVLELVNNISTGDVILLKASRSEKFEDLAKQFSEEATTKAKKSTGGLGRVLIVLIKAFVYFIIGIIVFALVVALFGIGVAFTGLLPFKNYLIDNGWQNVFAWGTLLLFIWLPIIAIVVLLFVSLQK